MCKSISRHQQNIKETHILKSSSLILDNSWSFLAVKMKTEPGATCLAVWTAISRPMPREAPVMITSDFPKIIFWKLIWRIGRKKGERHCLWTIYSIVKERWKNIYTRMLIKWLIGHMVQNGTKGLFVNFWGNVREGQYEIRDTNSTWPLVFCIMSDDSGSKRLRCLTTTSFHNAEAVWHGVGRFPAEHVEVSILMLVLGDFIKPSWWNDFQNKLVK